MTSSGSGDRAAGFAADTGRRVTRLEHGAGREALIRAVVRVVAAQGLSGLSYRAVAQEAGGTHGLVHYHFGSRDRMLVETMRWVVENAMSSMGLVPEDVEGDEPLGGFPAALAEVGEEERQAHLFANEFILAACRQDELHAVAEPVYDYVFSSVAQAHERAGIDPTPALSRAVFATINGLTIQHLFFGSADATRDAAEELRQMLDALRARSTR
jgi:AcrR family transcriptional regulator